MRVRKSADESVKKKKKIEASKQAWSFIIASFLTNLHPEVCITLQPDASTNRNVNPSLFLNPF